MKKKGFTLVEIIVVIALIAFIGTVSFFGIRLISKNIRINKLSQITDESVQAAKIYLETNKEAYNQLHKKKNGVVVPLNVLVDEGLLTLENTDLKTNDIKGEYVVSFLEAGAGSTSNCVDIRTETSWYEGSSAPIYICTDSSGNSNLAVINPQEFSNYTKATNQIYYYKGAYPNNYAKFNGKNLRILSVDTDDSITIITSDFSGYGFNTNQVFNSNTSGITVTAGQKHNVILYDQYYTKEVAAEGTAPSKDYIYDSRGHKTGEYNIIPGTSGYGYGYEYHVASSWLKNSDKYIHLKSCMKIKSGTGAEDNPYIIEQSGSCN